MYQINQAKSKLQFSNLMNVQNLPSYRPQFVVDKMMKATKGVVL